MNVPKLALTTLATVTALGAVACGPDIPGEWKAFVPTEGLQLTLPPKEEGKTKSFVLNYNKDKVSGDKLRGQFVAKLKPEGFHHVSECVSENGTSSAMFVGKDKEVFQVIINLLGDNMLDVELQRASGLPGIALPAAECTFTEAAKDHCTVDGDRCKF